MWIYFALGLQGRTERRAFTLPFCQKAFVLLCLPLLPRILRQWFVSAEASMSASLLVYLSERGFVRACLTVSRRILPPSRESRKPSRASVAAAAAEAGWQEALVFHFCHPLLTAARLHRMAGRGVESRDRLCAGWRPWDPDGCNCRGGGL